MAPVTTKFSYDAASFKGMEQAGWEKNAADYDELFGSITRHAIEPLLEAAAVHAGTAMLDLCCGPGYGAAAAVARGAHATGIDFSHAMVQTARALHPRATFLQGDAEALDFESESFGAAICSFGVNHLPTPEKAFREAHRVLIPGGRFAFSMWCAPGKSKFHQLVLESIRAHGEMDVPLPPAPPPFRFSDPATCAAELIAAGFNEPQVAEIPLAFRPRAAVDVLALTRCAVRLEMMIELQDAPAQARIRQAIVEGAEKFRTGTLLEIPMPAVLASGIKGTRSI
jgi:SAM-dependent methyltransferase